MNHLCDRQNQFLVGVAEFHVEHGSARLCFGVDGDLAQAWKRIALTTSGGLRAHSIEDRPQHRGAVQYLHLGGDRICAAAASQTAKGRQSWVLEQCSCARMVVPLVENIWNSP